MSERLNRMLSNIPDKYDKNEGLFFYDNLQAVDIELKESDKKVDKILDQGFAETSEGVNLDKKVSEQGITRKPPTKATTTVLVTGSQGANINIGDRVSSDTVDFIFKQNKVIDSSDQTTALVECVEFGSIGNVPQGAIRFFPVTIAGLTSVTNPNAVTNGYDGELDSELRQRYFDKVRTPATSGNKYHYRNWAREVVGVGDAKVFPLANGPGTVKIIIINSNKRAADTELINNTLNHIEENRPIGATVTVESAIEKTMNVNAILVIDSGNYTLSEIQTSIEEGLAEYFKDIAFINDYVSYAFIGNLIFNTKGVLDYSNLLINSSAANIIIDSTEVPVVGVVALA